MRIADLHDDNLLQQGCECKARTYREIKHEMESILRNRSLIRQKFSILGAFGIVKQIAKCGSSGRPC